MLAHVTDRNSVVCVSAGQRICGVGEGNVAGSGTYTRGGFIYASLAGYVTRTVNDDKTVFTYCTTVKLLIEAPGFYLNKCLRPPGGLVLETRLILETRLLFEQKSPNPGLVLETQLILETRLVFEVLQYLTLLLTQLFHPIVICKAKDLRKPLICKCFAL